MLYRLRINTTDRLNLYGKWINETKQNETKRNKKLKQHDSRNVTCAFIAFKYVTFVVYCAREYFTTKQSESAMEKMERITLSMNFHINQIKCLSFINQFILLYMVQTKYRSFCNFDVRGSPFSLWDKVSLHTSSEHYIAFMCLCWIHRVHSSECVVRPFYVLSICCVRTNTRTSMKMGFRTRNGRRPFVI